MNSESRKDKLKITILSKKLFKKVLKLKSLRLRLRNKRKLCRLPLSNLRMSLKMKMEDWIEMWSKIWSC